MRFDRLIVAALTTAAAIGLLASCQPKSGYEGSTLSHTDSLNATQDSVRLASSVAQGAKEFLANCAMCHGNGGNGDGDASKGIATQGVKVARLNDFETMDTLSRPHLVEIITRGGAHTGRSGIMPAWGEKLQPDVIDHIADFVMQLRTANPAIPRQTITEYLMSPPGVPADGRELYVHHCVACHGDQGKGDGPYGKQLVAQHNVHPRDLTDSTYIKTKTDQDIFATVALGGGHFKKAIYMPAWAVTLTPAQMKSLVAYVRAISHTPSKP